MSGATAVNVSAYPVRKVDFVVVLYDAEGTAIAASRTSQEKIQPGEERVIQYTWVRPLTLRKGQCPGGLCAKQVERIEITPIIFEW